MSRIESVVCPSCENEVEPVLKKLPGNADRKGRVGSAAIMFGHVCPVEGCGARLDATIEKAKREQSETNSEDAPNEVPVEPAIAPRPAPRPVLRLPKPEPAGDLFARIQAEHEDAIREERELSARLCEVRDRRERLDRIVAAMNGMSAAIAAE